MATEIVKHFDSVHDFYRTWDKFEAAPDTWADYEAFKNQLEKVMYCDQQWFGASREHLDAHRYGDEELLHKAAALNEFKNYESGYSRKVNTFSDDGDDMDMERFMEGEENCFIKRVKRTGKNQRKILSIYINLSEHCGIKAEDMMYKTLAAIKLCDSLEAGGDRVEVIVYNRGTDCTRKGEINYTASITLKKPEEPLNLSLIAHHCTPAFYRYFLLGSQCHYVKNIIKGLSYPANRTDIPESAFHIARGECLSLEAANAWLQDRKPKP